MKMLKVIIIYILIAIVSFMVGLNISLNHTKSSLHRETNIKDVSLDRECEGGICPPPEEYENGGNR